MSSPIYLQQIWVENVKTFAGRAELHLAKADGTLPQWTLILGDNGIGKSTLLQLIAWVKPTLSTDGKPGGEEDSASRGELLITNEENDVLERLVHRGGAPEPTARIEAVFVAGTPLNKRSRRAPSRCETSIKIETNDAYELKHVTVSIRAETNGVFYRDDVVIYAYSASRQLGKQNLSDKTLLDTIPNFIREKTVLYDAEEILHSLDYASLKGTARERKKYRKFLERLKQMLVTLLPDVASSKDIDINPPRILDFNREGGVVITTKYGKRVPFSDFSLGYRTISSWTIDLAWRLFTKHPTASDPLSEPGIVLIDELDLHLHPVWQRQVMSSLTAYFPHMQFIATAHSPLMVQAAATSNYAVLQFDKEQDCVVINNEPTGIDGWRVDQILTSELFGLKSARGEQYDKLVEQREQLLSKNRLTKQDHQTLASVTKQLAELPAGETPEEMNDRQEIAKLARRIREGQVRIEL